MTDFGLFVELDEFYIDGLVHITSLGQDYYRFDAERRLLKGESSGRTYKIGQKLEVQIARVDIDQGRIDFSLIEVRNEKFSKGRSRKNRTNDSFKRPSKPKKGKSKPKSKKSAKRN